MAEIIIAGAGPSGLTLACELARRGLMPRVVDKSGEPAPESRALGLNARTLEVFDAMGVIGPVLEQGRIAKGFTVHGRNGRSAGRLPLAVEGLSTPYPFEIVLAQSSTVRILLAAFERLGGRVEWLTELSVEEPGSGRPAVTLAGLDGRERATPDWLVGADGAASAVRRDLKVPFEGTEYEEGFLLADVRVAWDLAPDDAHLFLRPNGPFVAFPYPEDGRWRLVDTSGEAETGEAAATVARFQQLLDGFGVAGRVSDPTWTSLFHVHRRLVDTFRPRPRVLLIGDAAHIHSPASGQGLNTGVQDAFNLGWKLEAVASGRLDAALLDTLTDERRPIAEQVLRDSDRITRGILLRNPAAEWLRDHLVKLLLGVPAIRRVAADGISKLGVNYGPGIAVAGDPDARRFAGGPKPGERAPSLAPGKNGSPDRNERLLDFLRGERFTLLLIPGQEGPPETVHRRDEDAIAPLAELIDIVELRPIRGPAGHAFQPDPTGAIRTAYGADGQSALYLIRPDGYVALRASPTRPDPVLAYFQRLGEQRRAAWGRRSSDLALKGEAAAGGPRSSRRARRPSRPPRARAP